MSTLVSPLATLGAIRRRTTTLALLLTMVAAALVGPSVVAPRLTDSASAAVYSSCTMSAAARTPAPPARAGPPRASRPAAAGTPGAAASPTSPAAGSTTTRVNCPTNATYYEYDVYPRTQGAARDAYRIVVNRSTGVTWFSPNHYTDFYRL